MCACEQIQRTSGLWYSAEYSTFSISDEASKYRLTVDGYSGDAVNAMMITVPGHNYASNGKMFSTPDSDNDEWGDSCAVSTSCGWWFAFCSISALNVVNEDYGGYGIWTTDYPPVWDVQASRMLVKLN